MELQEAIQKRRSIRKYNSNKVAKEELIDLIKLATLAPSAHNRQPWRFMILEEAQKNNIAQMMIEYQSKNSNNPDLKTMGNTASIIKNAPHLIAVLKEKDEKWQTLDIISIGASIEHICLSAQDKNLATLWINDIDPIADQILNYINHKELELVSVIAIGYPDESPKQRPRKPLNEIIIN